MLLTIFVVALLVFTLSACRSSEKDKKDDVTEWDGSVASGFAGGDGTKANPYLISNNAELAYLAQITNDINYNTLNKYFKLINDVDLGGREWKPIGVHYYASGGSYSSSPYCRFCGHFD